MPEPISVLYAPAMSKAEATARMYYLGNRVAEPLGPGSKEKRSSLEALASFADLDLRQLPGKVECGRAIAEAVGARWDADCYSTGDTITLVGMNRLLDGVLQWHIRSGRQPVRSLIRDLISLNPAPRWDENTEDSMSLDVTEIEDNIAELIADLSRASTTPTGATSIEATELVASEIRFEDGSWRSALRSVEGWLHLASEIDTTDDTRFDESLRSLLNVTATEADTSIFGKLEERLERATALRDDFLAQLESEAEGTSTLQTASAEWHAAWEELEEIEEAESAGPINANAHVWQIKDFRELAIDGLLELSPSYQRADVWPTADAQQLIESILRGIPLPSVILLERQSENGLEYEIIDGKQRLTSILRFTGSHPKARATVAEKAEAWSRPDAIALFQTDYPRFKKLWREQEPMPLNATLEKQLYFPFPLRRGDVPALAGGLTELRGRFYTEIRLKVIEVGGIKQKIETIFESGITQYRVPVLTYLDTDSDQIHEVFTLYNKQGKHLNAEEIRNAKFHRLDLMRGLLAAGGDAARVEVIAPFLADQAPRLREVSKALVQYGLGDAGFKRTKTLSWVAAALVVDDEAAESKSTATHINQLLEAVRKDKNHALRESHRVADLVGLLSGAVDAHASAPPQAWPPKFRNAQRPNGKWQELQLVATLIALAAAGSVRGESVVDDLDDATGRIALRAAGWVRPSKTQSREQWLFIGQVVRELLEELEVDVHEADAEIRSRFGSSGLSHLVALPEPKQS